MANCVYNTSYSNGCRDSMAGIQEVYIRSYSSDTTFTYDAVDNGIITGCSNTVSTFYTIEQRNENANFIPGAGEHNIENGVNIWTQTLDLVFHKYKSSLRNLVYSLAQDEVEVIVLDQNGNYFWMGEQNGANLTASNASVGKAFTDLQGATVSLTAKEPAPARQVSATLIATLTFV